jgi:glyoxylase-like metal-dependent hydrolase (beta-lactamase superfamily II)
MGFRLRVTPQPGEVNLLSAGSAFRMAGREWQLIGGEGHAPGHISFYDPKERRLLCGDMVLPDISPNIGWMPDSDPDPLGSFMDTMRNLLSLDVKQAYPGHRDPFDGFGERVSELITHHDRRLDKVLELVGAADVTSFELCE